MKKITKSACFFVVMLLITVCIQHFVRIEENRQFDFLYLMTKGYQMRSIVLSIVLFLTGIPAVLAFRDKEWKVWELLMHIFPIAVLEWIALSMVCILASLPYTAIMMIILEITWNVPLIIRMYCRRGEEYRFQVQDVISALLIVLGVVCVLSTGLVFTWVDSDGYYFITMLGKTMASVQGIIPDMATYLTHTAIGISTLSSLSYMGGLDNFYLIHHILAFDIIALFGIHLYKNTSTVGGAKPLVKVILWILLFFSCPMCLYMFGQIINNAYVMFYLLYFVLLIYDDLARKDFSIFTKMVLCLLSFAFVSFRADACLTICCVMVALGDTHFLSKSVLAVIYFPSLIAWTAWYVRIYLLLGGVEGSLLNSGTTICIILVYAGTFFYYVCIRDKVKFLSKYYRRIVFSILTILIIATAIIFPEDTIHVLKPFLYNFSSVMGIHSGLWGVSFVTLGVLWIYSHIISEKQMNIVEITFVLLCFSVYFLGLFRGALVDMPPRLGFGDSFNRAFISYIPILLYGIYLHLYSGTVTTESNKDGMLEDASKIRKKVER